VDATLLRDGGYAFLPKGYPYFQGRDEETGLDEAQLTELIDCVRQLNPKLYELQRLTGEI
jgi:hypothetical protein